MCAPWAHAIAARPVISRKMDRVRTSWTHAVAAKPAGDARVDRASSWEGSGDDRRKFVKCGLGRDSQGHLQRCGHMQWRRNVRRRRRAEAGEERRRHHRHRDGTAVRCALATLSEMKRLPSVPKTPQHLQRATHETIIRRGRGCTSNSSSGLLVWCRGRLLVPWPPIGAVVACTHGGWMSVGERTTKCNGDGTRNNACILATGFFQHNSLSIAMPSDQLLNCWFVRQ